MRWGQLSGSGLRFYIILKLKTQSVLIRHLLKKDQLPQCIHLWFRLLEICMFFCHAMLQVRRIFSIILRAFDLSETT